MRIGFDYTNMMASILGPERGISETELEGLRPRTEAIHRDLMVRREKGLLPFYELPFDKGPVDEDISHRRSRCRDRLSCQQLTIVWSSFQPNNNQILFSFKLATK
jgi:hypothetical protein